MRSRLAPLLPPLAFAACLALTWAAEAAWVRSAAPRLAAMAEARTAAAFEAVEASLRELHGALERRAEVLAASPLVADALRSGGEREGALVRALAARGDAAREAVEVYAGSNLVAWSGAGIEAAPGAGVRFVREGAGRAVLAVGVTVRVDGRARGFVRASRVVRERPPVQNRYLRNYDLAREAARPFGVPAALSPLSERDARPVYAADGVLLARVRLDAPPPETLLREGRRRFADVRAFWATLLGAWLVADAYRRLRRARRGRARMLAAAWGALAAVTAGLRALLLALDVPGRWATGKSPLAPLFDPERFATPLFGGALRSAGDAFVTVAFALGLAAVGLGVAARVARAIPAGTHRGGRALALAAGAAAGVFALVLGGVLAALARRAVLDSTLDLFARNGLLPEPLVSALFCTLLGAALALGLAGWALGMIAVAAACGVDRARGQVSALVGAGSVVLASFALADPAGLLPAGACLAAAAALALGAFVPARRFAWGRTSVLGVLLGLLALTALLYPLLYNGVRAQRSGRMEDAAAEFDERQDPRAPLALTEALTRAGADDGLRALLAAPPDSARRARLDARAADLVRGALLGTLGPYDVSLTFFDSRDSLAGRFADGTAPLSDALDADDFGLLRAMQAERARLRGRVAGPTVEPVTGRREADRFQYLGVVAIGRAGWATARAEPQPSRLAFETPFPRVLLPAGATGGLPVSLAVALFRDGVLVRGVGRDFGRYRLDADVMRALGAAPELFRTESVRGERFVTLYRREAAKRAGTMGDEQPAFGGPAARVVAVRAPAFALFDHLFFGLRLMLAGLFVGVPAYLAGLAIRWRAGLFPARRVRFQDRVLNAFLAVGTFAIVAVGLVGLRVVTRENARAVEQWLDASLERVEATLALEARPGELPYAVLERVSVDSLARRVGLDLSVYRGPLLVATSRPNLVRERLIEPRLPAAVHASLALDGDRFTTAPARIGTFRYRAGFRALPDERGAPRYVLSVPTLPEQERIEEEQARMTAYLLGALLLLVLVVLATAWALAQALTRPIARLQSGLEAVGRGRFEGAIPVTSRDEIGSLVRTFNAMQEQLSDSRRRLAQQERQLAWREMARQVAHEIKNPLTPMKLSIQHLRRAYVEMVPAEPPASGDGAAEHRTPGDGPPAVFSPVGLPPAGLPPAGLPPKFARLFDRITTTLLEQIDTLTRIAGDFSTFARLPRRVVEPLDLSRVAEEAAHLMQEEEAVDVEVRLADGALVVQADREELRRLYINLIKNGIQASDGASERRVVVTTRREGREAVSTVRDFGSGIPEPLRAKIFEPNFSTKTSGTGLGLAIVKKAVEDMGGEIGFETEEGAGTTFTLRLPLDG